MHPRRHQYRLLFQAAAAGTGAAAALIFAVSLLTAGQITFALTVAAIGVLAGLRAAYLHNKASRYKIGADSEQKVPNELKVLERAGWRIRHSLEWGGTGRHRPSRVFAAPQDRVRDRNENQVVDTEAA